MHWWKFYTATAVNSCCGENKPVLVGGLGERNYGKQYRQGNRVYSSNNIAMRCLSQPIGNSGGYSYLYLVDDIYNHREPRIYENYSPTIRAER